MPSFNEFVLVASYVLIVINVLGALYFANVKKDFAQATYWLMLAVFLEVGTTGL